MSESSSTAPKFQKGQSIRHNDNQRLYIVRRTPDVTFYNCEPSYQLEMIGPGPKTPPFYRDQIDVEANWHDPAQEAMFEQNELLKNKATGVSFMVIGLPKHYRIYSTNERVYVIQGPDGVRDVIAQADAEDGRFLRVNVRPAKHYTNDE